MENKINIAELLKDCPTGMKLNCTIYENVEFDLVDKTPEVIYPIQCLIKTNAGYESLLLTYNGCYDRHPNAKCVIFPEGKTTWEGFVPPRKFKIGDIVATNNGTWIGIAASGGTNTWIPTYCVIKGNDTFKAYLDKKERWIFDRLATEKEKERLFQAIKDNGFKWNAETKTLEKLCDRNKFTIGDTITNGSKRGKNINYILKL